MKPSAISFYEQATTCLQQANYREAIAFFEQYLATSVSSEEFIATHIDIAACYYHLHEYESGLAHVLIAEEKQADHFLVLKMRGVFAIEAGNDKAGIDYYRRALEKQPGAIDVLNNLGLALREAGEFVAARSCFEKALSVVPRDRYANNNLALVELVLGEYRNAWNHYQYRDSSWYPNVDIPEFSSLATWRNRKITLIGEQGYGDELFFLRFVPTLVRNNVAIDYFGSQQIIGLLAKTGLFNRLNPLTQDVVSSLRKPIRIGDLPRLCGMTSESDIPPPLALQSNPKIVAELTGALAQLGPPPYIGLTWRAGPADSPRRTGKLAKSVSFEQLKIATQATSGTLLALQRLPQKDEIKSLESCLNRRVFDVSSLNQRLEVILALLSILDFYFAVSNTNVHLRASLGKPCTVFVPFAPEWRWQNRSSPSPWFPQYETIRQQKDGRWV